MVSANSVPAHFFGWSNRARQRDFLVSGPHLSLRKGATNVSMILAALHDTVLAEVSNPSPEAPPLADKLMQMGRYFTWLVQLSGITAITYGGGRFAWEKWSGGGLQSPKMIASAMAGGAVATSAGTIMNSVIG
ncbi:hypothetical protein O3I_017160 [Nocardia brasiliensis ATCC 700358]|uniref:Uncharacterized protein n=2 Tax=Nocardia brasiliensis TaxID=37326 RepID=K0EP15_NOCB7|nr:hypothetical protein O3I_017160 [Nocardia brasiliensis ATCC 700358]